MSAFSLDARRGGSGRHRKADYRYVIKFWNDGYRRSEVARLCGIASTTVKQICDRARQSGLRVRRHVDGPIRTVLPGPRVRPATGCSSCVTCRRTLTRVDHCRPNHVLPEAECCRWCGRRWDGGVHAPAAFFAWIKGTLETVDSASSRTIVMPELEHEA